MEELKEEDSDGTTIQNESASIEDYTRGICMENHQESFIVNSSSSLSSSSLLVASNVKEGENANDSNSNIETDVLSNPQSLDSEADGNGIVTFDMSMQSIPVNYLSIVGWAAVASSSANFTSSQSNQQMKPGALRSTATQQQQQQQSTTAEEQQNPQNNDGQSNFAWNSTRRFLVDSEVYQMTPPPPLNNRRSIVAEATAINQAKLMIQGSYYIIFITIITFVLSYALAGFFYGVPSLVLLTLSLLPAVAVPVLLRCFSVSTLSVKTMTEMFWCGGILSILLASLLESFFQYRTRQIWECQASAPSVSCDLRFMVVVIVGVGFVEELSKLLPVWRIHVSSDLLFPVHHSWWFRLIDSPLSLALAGCCSAAGFAGIENIKYVFSENAKNGFGTSLVRGILAVPFHMACTTYASCKLAHLMFKPAVPAASATSGSTVPSPYYLSYNSNSNSHRVPELVPFTSNSQGSSTCQPTCNGTYDAAADVTNGPGTDGFTEQSTLFNYLKALSLPSVCHGIYDIGLFLAAQFTTLGQKDVSKPPTLPPSLITAFGTFLPYLPFLSDSQTSSVSNSNSSNSNISSSSSLRYWIGGTSLSFSVSPSFSSATAAAPDSSRSSLSGLYDTLMLVCLSMSLLSYLTILVATVRAWLNLKTLKSEPYKLLLHFSLNEIALTRV